MTLERHNREAASAALNDAIGRGGEPIRTLAADYPELRSLASEIP
jgi:DNA mismatch repair protein MutH